MVIKLHKCLARTYFFFKFTENKIYFTNYIRKKWTIILFYMSPIVSIAFVSFIASVQNEKKKSRNLKIFPIFL